MHSIYSSLESPWFTLYLSCWTFFAFSYGWDIISGHRSKSAVIEGGWVTLSTDFRGKGHRPPTTVGVRVPEWLPFRVVSKCLQCVIYSCHNLRVWQTDRIMTPKTAVAYTRTVTRTKIISRTKISLVCIASNIQICVNASKFIRFTWTVIHVFNVLCQTSVNMMDS